MLPEHYDYRIFHDFFTAYARAGIEGVNDSDPLLIELNRKMDSNNQLFYIADVILLDILFISKQVYGMFGIEPEKVSTGFFLTSTHADDQRRHHMLRAKLLNDAQELYILKGGNRIYSSNFRSRKPDGKIANLLYQAFIFYSPVPYESTFLILVITDISELFRIHKGFHFYVGEDRSYFRFPDEQLLMSVTLFTESEFRIIELIEEGYSSKEIAGKIHRSVYTISTHRSNILEKSQKASITEVIYDLKKKGLL